MGMAVHTMKVRTCDICGDAEAAASPYRLGRMGENPRTETIDLCVGHAAPVEELIESRPETRSRKRAVVTKEQIAAKKTARKKAAKKS